MRWILWMAVLAVAGCAEVVVQASSPTGITLFVRAEWGRGSLQAADDIAQRHCAASGLVGRQTWISPAAYTETIRYECVAAPR